MSAWVLGLVLAAAGSTEVEGAATVGGFLSQRQAASVGALVHARAELSRDFGRFFFEAHGSILLTGSTGGFGLRDLGSTFTLGYRPAGFVKRVSLELIPFNPSIRLPSFDWANAWGAVPFASALAPTGVVLPMITGQVETTAGTLWVSGRFKTQLNPMTQLSELLPDVFVGLDVPFTNGLRLEARGGWLNYGDHAALGSIGVKLPLFGAAGGARLSWAWNEPVGPAIDLITYAADPLRFERFFGSEPRRSPFAAWFALEGGGGAQQLADPQRFGEGKLQPMAWIDLQARVRLRDLRLFGTARVQSIGFVLFDLTGVPPGTALSPASVTTPGVTGIVGADFLIRALRLTPGLLFRVSQYAGVGSFQAIGGNNPPPLGPARFLLVGPNGLFAIVSPEKVAPLVAVKVSARWEVVSFASVVAELDVEQDLNDYGITPGAPPVRSPATVTGQLFLQARW